MSLPAWAAWIEILGNDGRMVSDASLPAWAAWIEIHRFRLETKAISTVAARMGSVD